MFAEWDSQEFVDAIQPIIDASETTGVPVGTLTVDIDAIDERLEQGFDFLIAGKDISLLMESVERAICDYSTAVERQAPTSSFD
jgi:2-keto-3-deoxy-L-rhamnonate aldolase RhmA